MLKINNLVVSYGLEPVIKNVDIHVPEGKIIALLGANGAGKSTILKAISGLVKPVSGEILFHDEDISKRSPDKIIRLGISQVPEGREVFPGLTVEENLKMGLYTNFKKGVYEERVEQIYSFFPRLAERKTQLSGTMSGGEQQMLVIGRGLMSNPKLLMLDEPSLGLAPIIVDDIFDKIQEINESGTTVLLIEQNATLALSISDYAYVLNIGSVVLHGLSEDIQSDQSLMSSYLGGAGGAD
ncbi:MAG TPA: ABC transporter ATP-binding protein [Clostridiaceae bacterium]|nr:ABC transporter ATP-binding protein [Clostridiaceae bacterium]